MPSQKAKELGFLNRENCFETDQNVFNNIPKKVFAYWASKEVIKAFTLGRSIGSIADVKVGLQTGANEKYVRNWTELDITTISFGNQLPKQWVPYNKGGGYWRWYGLNTTVVDWRDNGFSIKHEPGAILRNVSFYFKEGITWSGIASINGSFRYSEKGFLFDSNKGPMIFRNRTNLYPILGLLNSKVATSLIEMLNPSVSLQLGNVASIPMLSEAEDNQIITEIVKNNILISKEDWDSFETSWDFQLHPLVAFKSGAGYVNTPVESWIGTIQGAFYSWQADADARFAQLKTNEEELNRIFIDIYGLQDELTPEVEEKDVTVRRADLQRDIKSLISYAVGCMFGRYSLDVPGLAYAGGEWDASQYTTVRPDSDAIIPICDDEYFEDDIVGRFVKFVEVVYGKETLEDNLRFIADALGGKGSSREVIRNYFINDFYADHLKVYQKRPIYWLFDSGKKNGFKCLIYMHRYQPDTIARIRTDYVHEQQSRYRTAIADLEQRINGTSTSERVKLSKQLSKLQAQAEEIRVYEEKIHHLADQMIKIDLDDGVKHNYEIFKDVLAKIK